jgi:hypothetical protein
MFSIGALKYDRSAAIGDFEAGRTAILRKQ